MIDSMEILECRLVVPDGRERDDTEWFAISEEAQFMYGTLLQAKLTLDFKREPESTYLLPCDVMF